MNTQTLYVDDLLPDEDDNIHDTIRKILSDEKYAHAFSNLEKNAKVIRGSIKIRVNKNRSCENE